MKNKLINILKVIILLIVFASVSIECFATENNIINNSNNIVNENIFKNSETVEIDNTVANMINLIQIIGIIIGIILLVRGIILKKRGEKFPIYVIIYIIFLFVMVDLLGMVKSFKPIIYIYPEEETNVIVKVGYPEKLTCTYPKYEKEGWQVIASPDGTLKDIRTDRELYSLYWEGKNTTKPNYKEGFVIKGEDTIKFLEEKLEILGLNEKEAEEFIVYWLPQMEKNHYNYIRFETIDEINENMPLEIIPEPDTLIRINMEFKPLLFPIKVEEQQLKQVERQGYTVVEWGGTKL